MQLSNLVFLPLLHPTLPNADEPVATELKGNPISKSTGQDVVFPTGILYKFSCLWFCAVMFLSGG